MTCRLQNVVVVVRSYEITISDLAQYIVFARDFEDQFSLRCDFVRVWDDRAGAETDSASQRSHRKVMRRTQSFTLTRLVLT